MSRYSPDDLFHIEYCCDACKRKQQFQFLWEWPPTVAICTCGVWYRLTAKKPRDRDAVSEVNMKFMGYM